MNFMDNILISIVSIVIFGIITIISLVLNGRSQKKEHDTNYYFMFVTGCIFITFGLFLDIQGFTIIGVILALTGFMNKDKWLAVKDKNKMTKAQRITRLTIIVTTIIALVIGMIIFVLSK